MTQTRSETPYSLKLRFVLSLAGTLLLCDQATKIWVMQTIPLWSSVTVVPDFFDLVHVQNKGAAFGFLNTQKIDWQRWFFAAAAVLAVGIVLHMVKTQGHDRRTLVALGCVLGGALGNLIDRLRLGVVVDFLDFAIADRHWPAFNVADVAISVGAGLLILAMLRPPKNTGDSDNPSAPQGA